MQTITTEKTRRKQCVRTPVRLIVKHEFVDDKPLAEAFAPVITEVLRSKVKRIRTFDSKGDSS